MALVRHLQIEQVNAIYHGSRGNARQAIVAGDMDRYK